MRHHAGPVIGWYITDHVCRVCLGRVLVSADSKRVRCADCGLEKDDGVSAICCCGVKLATGKGMGLRCKVNDLPTPDLPQQITVEYVSSERRHVPRTIPLRDFRATGGQSVLGDDGLFPQVPNDDGKL